MRYVESLNTSLHGLMKAHPEVLVIGEDLLDPYGGAFKVTRGLSTAFPDRVLPAPLSEAGLTGAGIGMAMRGLRPIVEIMFGDFLTLCADQIVNHAAKLRWMYDDQVSVPLVIRTPMGGYRAYGPTHSQSLESLFNSVPMMRMVAPSHYHDPGELLRLTVMETPDPTLFIEHKLLYPRKLVLPGEQDKETRMTPAALPESVEGYPTVSLRMVDDEEPEVTLIAYGGMAPMAAEAAARAFKQEEVAVELLVPSLIKPLPVEDLLSGVRRSGRAIVLEEGPRTGGWGAEVASRIHEEAFGDLRAPVVRIGARDLPIPSAANMEKEVLPAVEDVESAIERLTRL